MNLLLQTLLDGLVLGGVFSLAAAGFSLIFGVMNVVNLTHGIIVLIGAYLAWSAQHFLGLDPLLAIWKPKAKIAASVRDVLVERDDAEAGELEPADGESSGKPRSGWWQRTFG